MKREEMKALFVFIAVLLFLVFVSCLANGQSTADVRIKTADIGGTFGHGSGTVIHGNSEGSIVLTVAHNVRDTKTVSVMALDGRTSPAEVWATDARKDLALLWTTLKTKGYRPLATSYSPNEQVFVTGWPGTGQKFRFNKTSQIGRYDTGSVFQGYAIQGQSGGAVINESGHVVGVVSATDATSCFAPSGELVFSFVKKSLAGKYETQCIGGRCEIIPQYRQRPLREIPMLVETDPKPRQPPAIVQPPKSACPQPEMSENRRKYLEGIAKLEKSFAERDKEIAELRAKIESNAAKQEGHTHPPSPTIPGPSGQRGPQGEPGPPGPPGKDASVDIDAIVARVIAQLPKKEAPSREPGQPIYYDLVPK